MDDKGINIERGSKILNLDNLPVGPNNLFSLFQATSFLEHLHINFLLSEHRNNEVDDILVRIFHSASDQYSSHESFLPHLQYMECSRPYTLAAPFAWDRIPDLYRLGHRCSLTLKSVANTSETSDETAEELLKLVDEGAKLLISDSPKGGDFLENSRKRIGTEGR